MCGNNRKDDSCYVMKVNCKKFVPRMPELEKSHP